MELAVRLLRCIRWPLTVYEVAISEMGKFEKVMNKAVRKWLGVPHWPNSTKHF